MSKSDNNLAYLIDDDEIIIYLTQRLLLSENYCKKVEYFLDASAAIYKLKESVSLNLQLPQFILLDLNMPGMDGWSFIEEFKTLNLDIPIFILTSSIDPNDKVRAYHTKEIKAFIIKPLTKIAATKILRLL